MEILELELDKLKPYDKNAKTHPEEQVQLIANSIKEFGFRTPILVDEDFVIIQGHGRRLASQSLGLNTVPCVIADNLSKDQVKMLRLADNKVAESEWDIPLLDMELLDLNEFFELEDFGFEFEEPNDLNEEEADTVPELVEDPCIKLGDLIELGNHRLLCGDSTSEDDVAKLMDGKKADMVFTDPPYNVNYGNSNNPRHKSRTIKNDIMSDKDWDIFVNGYMEQLLKNTNGNIYISMSDKELGHMQETFKKHGGKWASFIIWVKDRLVLSGKDYHSRHETILYGWNDKMSNRHRVEDRKETDVWEIPRPSTSDLHPTMKPVALVERAIYNSSKTKDIVLDLFGGSGTTMIASENVTRFSRLMELDPKYAQVIIQRYCDYTGNDTINVNGEEVSWGDYKERAEHSREKVS